MILEQVRISSKARVFGLILEFKVWKFIFGLLNFFFFSLFANFLGLVMKKIWIPIYLPILNFVPLKCKQINFLFLKCNERIEVGVQGKHISRNW